MKKSLLLFIFAGLALLLGTVVLPNQTASAAVSTAGVKSEICQGVTETGGDCTSDGTGDINGLITNIVDILSVIVGIVAVIMIIISGLKFITSGGESSAVASAKKTIIYALVGLIIVGLAQIIVHFVVGHIAGV
ncbi:MAG: pilin [Candidatus Saccharimonadales bacterium]